MLVRSETNAITKHTGDFRATEVEVQEIYVPDRHDLMTSRDGVDYRIVRLVRTVSRTEDEEGKVVGVERYSPHRVTLRPHGMQDDSEDFVITVKVGDICRELGADLASSFPGFG